MLAIILNGCKEDSDTEKPVIKLEEPAEGDTLQIGGDHGVHFEAEFSDNEALASYKVDIHHNFDGHTHAMRSSAETGETVDFEFNRSWAISGRNVPIHHHEITIPENAPPGDYHLMVYCTDAAGNESYIAVNVVLSHEAGDDHDDE
ncbi:MAG: DUF4625 domain-containing protein [Dysgonamonadaceae bacterium]|jgi:hypothetical protein|nr:DUF4625 domain-containing protein [Dysgonamonadaceae bacterium]